MANTITKLLGAFLAEFFDEDDLKTFEGWLRYQSIDVTALMPQELETWRRFFEEARTAALASPKLGRMKFKPIPNEYRYGVAIRKGDDLWLTLWVKRSAKGEFFSFVPRADGRWNPHVSYHLDGTSKVTISQQLQGNCSH